ncbi:putative adipose-regulatory protein-domain-containing protein [Calycina marina]|uniref:Adipose-regulatory protein-domain-containing protein n=1 Tax=Calycina marina TaxID=1763456 RepID=A0A9P7Z8F2_9HELO|nr:putative adipose-regulatory protein-domain-containing protein [Calycina marina]
MKPVRIATSKPARQTYLNTLLFMIASAILLSVAIVAYILFYLNYVPQMGIKRIIHLQYGDGPHPYGMAALESSLISEQAYDITVSLHVPRSPINLERGNFMLSLSLLAPSYSPPIPTTILPSIHQKPLSSNLIKADILFTSRRPALLTYTSPLIALGERIFYLPLYILGLRHESEVLIVPMAESTKFKRGYKNIPGYVFVEIQSGNKQEVQVYDVHVHLTARFGGLRWMMYNWKLTSFVVFVGAFWFAEVLWSVFGWVILRSFFGASKRALDEEVKNGEGIEEAKEELEMEMDDPDLSDTPRTFPTFGRQVPLRYELKVKDEDLENYVIDETAIQPLAAEADDESESEDLGGKSGRDSGIGTSSSKGGDRGVLRRRSKGKGVVN